MRIRGKLLAGFYLVTILVLVAGLFGLLCTGGLIRKLEGGEGHFRNAASAIRATNSIAQMAEADLDLYLLIHDPRYKSGYLQRLSSLDKQVSDLQEQATGDGRGLLDRFKTAVGQLRTTGDRLIRLHDDSLEKTGRFVSQDHVAAIKAFYDSCRDLREKGTALAKFLANRERGGKGSAWLNTPVILRIITAVMAISVIGALILGYFLSGTITRPILKLVDWTAKIGSGDFDGAKPLVPKDEIGQLADSIGKMVVDLEKTTVSRAYLDSVMESLTEALIVTEPDATIAKVNLAAIRLTRYGEEDLLGKPLGHVISDEVVAGLSTGDTTPEMMTGNRESTCITRSGDEIPVLFSTSSIVDPDGRITGFVCTALEITWRKQAEQALLEAHEQLEQRVEERTAELTRMNKQLEMEIAQRKRVEAARRESEKRYRDLVNLSPDGIFLLVGGQFVFANPSMARILGAESPEELIDKRVLESVHPDFQDLMKEGGGSSLEQEGAETMLQQKLIRLDGTTVDVESASAPFVYQGYPARQVVVRDITERKRAETQVREVTSRLHSLVEAMPDIVRFKDTRLRHLLVNKAFEEFAGIDRKDVLGKTADELFPEELARQSRQGDEEVIRTGRLYSSEDYMSDDTGETRVYETVKFPVLDDTGQPIGLGGVSREITERKKAEKEVTESLREKEVLLREIHHRVKNNLQVISSLIQLQHAYVREKSVEEVLNELDNRIRTMALLHEHLHRDTKIENVNVKMYVSSIVESLWLSHVAGSQRPDLNIDIEDTYWWGIDTAVPCGLILNEIMTNALQHAFPHERSGEIRIGVRFLGEETYELMVGDDGVGIPDTVDIARCDTLGLVLINTLAEQLHAELEVKTGPGTEYRMTFQEVKKKRKR